MLVLVVALTTSCIDENKTPEGIRAASPSGGAKVIFDLDARPLPEIPFPNDVATRIDPRSPTGKRLNVSTEAPTDLESRVRGKANRLDGFGTFGPITVQFDGLLDLHNIADRHQEDVPDFRNDAVFLVNIDPDSEDYGKLEQLDLGLGNYPVTMKDPTKYFDFDPRVQGTNLLLESEREVDLNGNGVLDPIEDTDNDGVWDRPNTLDPDGDPLEWGQMLEHYERETNTLIIRTLDALNPATTYAVVLTDALIDEDGRPVDSPFATVNHTQQTPDLMRLKDALPRALPTRFNEELTNVRFAWSFTTQSSTRELEAIRAGLYGSGPLSWLSTEFPAEIKMLHRAKGEDDGEPEWFMKLDESTLRLIVEALAGGLSEQGKTLFIESFQHVDYIVGGSFITPYFLADQDGFESSLDDLARNENQFDDDESFRIDVNTGDASVGPDEATWWCAVPRESQLYSPPYPVVLYVHGYGSARVDTLGFVGAMAKFGLASCGVDAAGHGVVLPPEFDDDPIFERALERANLDHLLDVIQHGRARDLNNDGIAESGGDFWTADIFHTRDILRQSVVDTMQFVRILRTFDGNKRWPDSIDMDDPFVMARPDIAAGFDADGDGIGELAGDFNGDGIVDFGGEQPYYAWGTSLGGIWSPLMAGIEPAVTAAAPVAGGAGLLDIGHRSTQSGVPEAVILPVMGPVVLGRPDTDWDAEEEAWKPNGTMQLEWLVTSVADEVYIPFARVDGIEHGDQITVRNLKREERTNLVKPHDVSAFSVVRNGSFRTALAADAMNANEKRATLGFDSNFNVGAALHRLEPPEQGWRTTIYKQERQRGFAAETSVESTIDIDVPASQPLGEGFRPGRWSTRYEGVFTAPEDGPQTFQIEAQGRVEFYVDGTREVSGTDDAFNLRMTFDEGQQVSLRFDFTAQGADARAQLKWVGADGSERLVDESLVMTHQPLTDEELAEFDRHRITSLGGDATDFGDAFVVEIRDAEGDELKHRIDTFELDAVYENILYPAGSSLAALREGFGLKRQTPDLRRFIGLAQHLVDAADPAVYGKSYWQKPLSFPYDPNPDFRSGETNVLFIPTAGDSAVPIATGYAMARVAGVLDYERSDPRFGKTPNQHLIDNFAYEGVYWLDRFPEYPGALWDHDDLDRGQFTSDRYPERGTDPNPDAETPLRATLETNWGLSAMRVPYQDVQGNHSIFLPEPTSGFDIDAFMANQIAHYFASNGTELSDDPCMADYTMLSCDWFEEPVYATDE